MKRHAHRRRRGYFILDLAVGVALLGALLAVLAATNTQNRKATAALAQQRAALREAEAALVDLRLGRPVTAVAVDPLPADAAAPAPGAWRWVRVRAAYARGEVSLVGLAPNPAVEVTP